MSSLKYLALALFFVASVAHAAPSTTFSRTIIPETDSAFDLGTTTQAWRNLYVDNLVVPSIDVTNATATNATTTNLYTANLTLGSLTGFLKAAAGVVATALIDLAADITGVLPIANGGTNASSQTSNGVNYFNGTSITSGTGLTFDGTNLGVGSTTPGSLLSIGTTGWNFVDGATGTTTAQGHLSVNNLEVRGAASLNANIVASALTEGSVTFIGSGGAVSEDNSNFFWDDSNNRLGIGTASPSYPLQVTKNQDAQTAFAVTNSNTGSSAQAAFRLDSGTMYYASQLYSSGSVYNYTNASAALYFGNYTDTGKIEFLTGASPTAKVTIKNSGNVGIGTTAPGATYPSTFAGADADSRSLTITGQTDASGDPGIFLRRFDDAVGLDIYQNSGSGVAYIDNRWDSAGGTTQFRMKTAGTAVDVMTLLATGNVGIGTAAPTSKLTVADTVDTSSDWWSNTAATLRLVNAGAGASVLKFEDGQGRIVYGSASASDSLIFSSRESAGVTTEQIVFDNNGNVGIGTTTPNAPLTVNKTSTGTILNLERSDLGVSVKTDIVDADQILTTYGGFTDTTDTVRFAAPSTAAMYLFSNEVTDATTKNFRLGVPHYTNAEQPFLFGLMSSTSSGNALQLGGGSGLGNAATLMTFFTAANNTTTTGTERMRIASDGKISIGGVATPLSTLHVSSGSSGNVTINGNADDLIVENSANTGLTILGGAASTGSVYFGDPDSSVVGRITYDHSDNSTAFYTGNAEKLRITSAGYVGIGTTSPQALLHVYNASASEMLFETEGNSYLRASRGATNRRVQIEFETLLSNNWITGVSDSDDAGDGSEFFIGQSAGGASANFWIETNGNVGIGTTTPATKLDVNGSARTTTTTVTDGATVTIDASLGNNFVVTLGGNRTLAFSNLVVGQKISFAVTQDATGSRTLAYPAAVTFGSAGAPTLDTAAGSTDIMTFWAATSTATIHARFAD